jgi:hypothetical protein
MEKVAVLQCHIIVEIDIAAVPQPASHRGCPDPIPGQIMWDLWWTKWHWGRFSASTSVSPANSHSAERSILFYQPALVK